jgi:hypothetical protein
MDNYIPKVNDTGNYTRSISSGNPLAKSLAKIPLRDFVLYILDIVFNMGEYI